MEQRSTSSSLSIRPKKTIAAENSSEYFAVKALLFVGFHVPIAVLLQQNTVFPTIHALITLGVGILWLLHDKTSRRMTLVVAYVTGAELLWRATEARVFYEYGKYASVLLLVMAILKFDLLKKAVKWPIVYFALLLPSIFVMPSFDRQAISANLAGPLALALAVMFLSTQTFSKDQLQRLFVAMLAPIVGLGSLAVLGILTANRLLFYTSSNFQTSADFGPNQVSSILGLGALIAFLMALVLSRKNILLRLVMLGISLWLFAQTMLTFSRGGFWTSLGALGMGSIFLFQNARTRAVFVFSLLGILLIGYFYILPALDQFTGNTLQARFENLDSTGRFQIMQADWLIFQMHPVVGVGPGQSKSLHELTYRYASAHTEYSRLLAEHGILGLFSMAFLLGSAARRVVVIARPWQKALAVSFTIWTLLFLFHSATRLVAPSILFGLGAAVYLLDE